METKSVKRYVIIDKETKEPLKDFTARKLFTAPKWAQLVASRRKDKSQLQVATVVLTDEVFEPEFHSKMKERAHALEAKRVERMAKRLSKMEKTAIHAEALRLKWEKWTAEVDNPTTSTKKSKKTPKEKAAELAAETTTETK